MAHLSGVNFRLNLDAFPWLPGAIDCGAAGAFPGGKGNNEHYFTPWVEFGDAIDQLMRDLLWTPETSGGLLAAVHPGAVSLFLEKYSNATIIGEVLEGDGHIGVA